MKQRRAPNTNADLRRESDRYGDDPIFDGMTPRAAAEMAYRDGYRTALADWFYRSGPASCSISPAHSDADRKAKSPHPDAADLLRMLDRVTELCQHGSRNDKIRHRAGLPCGDPDRGKRVIAGARRAKRGIPKSKITRAR